MCRTQCLFRCCSVPVRCLIWNFGRKGQHFPLSLNCCVLSFDKFCYTRIQVSVKDLNPSTILPSLNECKKKLSGIDMNLECRLVMASRFIRVWHWISNLHLQFSSCFLWSYFTTLLPVFVYYFGYFVLQIMSQVEPGGTEGICCRRVVDRPYWNWSLFAQDYLVVIYYSVYAFVSRW